MLVFPCFFVGAVESKIFDRCCLILVFVRMLWAFDWAHILKVVATNHNYAANLIAMTKPSTSYKELPKTFERYPALTR